MPASRAFSAREGKVIWVTDADGADALEIADATGESRGTRRIAGGELGDVWDLVPCPDGTHVAVSARDGRLLIVTVESGEVLELAASDDGLISGLAWSPDSAWLAWSQPGPRPLSRIRIARITPESNQRHGGQGSGGREAETARRPRQRGVSEGGACWEGSPDTGKPAAPGCWAAAEIAVTPGASSPLRPSKAPTVTGS